jgi:hypothetical protein
MPARPLAASSVGGSAKVHRSFPFGKLRVRMTGQDGMTGKKLEEEKYDGRNDEVDA